MELSTFYGKLLTSLSEQGFFVDEEDIVDMNLDISEYDYNKYNKTLKFIAGFSKSMSNVDLNAEQFKADLMTFSNIADKFLVLYKYTNANLNLVGFINADDYSHKELIKISEAFHEIVLKKMRKHTGTNLQGNRLGTYGIISFVFNDSNKARSFLENTQSKCSHSSFLKLVYNKSWVFDLENKQITIQKGMGYSKMMDVDKLTCDIFEV